MSNQTATPTTATTATTTGTANAAAAATPKAAKKKTGRKFSQMQVLGAVCVVLLMVMAVSVITDGYYVCQLKRDVAGLRNRTIALESGAVTLTSRVKDSKGVLAALSGKINTIEQSVANLFGRTDAADGKIEALGKGLSAVRTAADKNAKEIGAVKATAEKAARMASAANARDNARVKAENQKYMTMLSYIAGANPSFSLCSKSSAEVEKLLNDGIWNIEPQIETEFVRLTEAKQKEASAATTAVQEAVQNVKNVADQALAAGETAVSSLSKIAEQKSKVFGPSVSKATKKSIAEEVAEYNDRYCK